MKLFDEISPELADWIAAQPVFFLASAPLAAEGHVNVSPRGLDGLRVTGPREVLIRDLTGSGNETAAHLAENGRITVMFCAFEGPPRILRLYGRGEVIGHGHPDWTRCGEHFGEPPPGLRQYFRIAVERIQTSCGFGVPLMDYRGDRRELLDWARRKGEEGLEAYRERHNRRSIDGLPAPD